MRTSIVSFIVILLSLYIIWLSNDNSLHPSVRRLHPKSFAAPGFESVHAKYEYVYCYSLAQKSGSKILIGQILANNTKF